jgi:hypothetical protein
MRGSPQANFKLLVGMVLVLFSAKGSAKFTPYPIAPVDEVYPLHPTDIDPPGSELTEKGRDVRGIYLPIIKLVKHSVDELVRFVVDEVGATAVVIDIKDDFGRVTFTRGLEGAGRRHHGFYADMPALVAALKAEEIYVIGRLVCFKDNYFHKVADKAGVRDRRTAKIWRDGIGMAWLNPYSEEAHDYITRIARAAEDIGFDEVQLDYVRFPVDSESRYARFVGRPPRHQAIAGLLERVDEALAIPLSIDVFGITAFQKGDANGLGQSLEHLAPHIDAISPMLYLANFDRRYQEDSKLSDIRTLVHNAVLEIRDRIGDEIAVRPLLQAFSYRTKHFGADFIACQIDAAITAGSSGYLLWNQKGNYRAVVRAWRNQARTVHPHILTPRPSQRD